MDKKTIEQLKERLEKDKAGLEKELERFAQKDEKIEGDWNTKFPHWDNDSGSSALERAADEVEEYSTLLPIEHSLEIRLRNINLALDKIKKGKYGFCEKCKKEINEERLKACPEARTCKDCN
jgi:RNA polymerase-binding transcription factor DksA